ncbi:hypothetical protein A0H76_1167 [Hepatospora eriocheir]|uniref:Uncharacterized protein n=1 Tax=Hepatospora eriocheir TaxID=1081669 RepID=A0A1X0QD39_9MICR|nr:hypothetical protein HERIO_431 [Hepatospora eriocheir]ORD99245.1 hypothetical protein A0H76_1167 [Hepatospora eriocheir]
MMRKICQICYSPDIILLDDYLYCEKCEIYYKMDNNKQKVSCLPINQSKQIDFILCAKCNHNIKNDTENVIICRTFRDFYQSFPICSLCKEKNSDFISRLFHNNFLNYKKEGQVFRIVTKFLFTFMIVTYMAHILFGFMRNMLNRSLSYFYKRVSIYLLRYFPFLPTKFIEILSNIKEDKKDYALSCYLVTKIIKNFFGFRSFIYLSLIFLNQMIVAPTQIDSSMMLIVMLVNWWVIDFIVFSLKIFEICFTSAIWYEIPYSRLLDGNDLHGFLYKMKLSNEVSKSQEFFSMTLSPNKRRF